MRKNPRKRIAEEQAKANLEDKENKSSPSTKDLGDAPPPPVGSPKPVPAARPPQTATARPAAPVVPPKPVAAKRPPQKAPGPPASVASPKRVSAAKGPPQTQAPQPPAPVVPWPVPAARSPVAPVIPPKPVPPEIPPPPLPDLPPAPVVPVKASQQEQQIKRPTKPLPSIPNQILRHSSTNKITVIAEESLTSKPIVKRLKEFDNFKSTQNNEQKLFNKSKELQPGEFRDGNKLIKVEKSQGKLTISSDMETLADLAKTMNHKKIEFTKLGPDKEGAISAMIRKGISVEIPSADYDELKANKTLDRLRTTIAKGVTITPSGPPPQPSPRPR